MIGRSAACVLALAIGCSSEPSSHDAPATVPPSTTTTSAPPVTTTTPPSTTTTTLPAPANADEARRLLEQQGVDPAELSREIGEHMRRRFGPAPAE
jgi:pyruvate/2-oxoglutarate dehydrogenase complex dihydrolipoamide acyltransferase (E2) component